MTREDTVNKLNQMKLFAMATSLRERLARTDHQDLGIEEMISLLVDDEWLARENRKLTTRIKKAKFKIPATMEAIDYQVRRELVKSKLMDLSTLGWIARHQNLILIGPAGIGKSFIAQALGHHACQKGFAVHYVRFTQLLHQLHLARADGTYGKLLSQLLKYDLLILDDWVSSLDPQEAKDLLEVIEDRHEIKSTIITSQIPIKHWHELIGNQTIADAICDRIVHNAHKIELRGETIRKLKGLVEEKSSRKEEKA
jgi:DNA replication protein DnaC